MSQPEVALCPEPQTVADALVDLFAKLRVAGAYGVIGGTIAPVARALARSAIPYVHFRHEGGAAFAATAASLATDCPVVVFTTGGPGMLNALIGLAMARYEGARVLLVSGASAQGQRGRGAFQEYGPGILSGMALDPSVFHLAQFVDSPSDMPLLARRLAAGFQRPEGFVAHLALPLATQTAPCPWLGSTLHPAVDCTGAVPSECVQALSEEPFAIWLGYGARRASAQVRALAERTGAPVLCSPRAKGIFPEDHPQFIGVTGLGGYGAVGAELRRLRVARTLVLGSRLSESTSGWDPELCPPRGFVHVDLDPTVPGTAYPDVDTMPVRAEIGAFLEALLEQLPQSQRVASRACTVVAEPPALAMPGAPVRPSVVLGAIQRRVVEGSDAIVIGEAGNAILWTSHLLRFSEPNRYQVGTDFASMGQGVSGVVGVALTRGKAVVVTGDGAMLMNNEISTAVAHGAPAVWIVLNDGRYNMIEQGMKSLGWSPFGTVIPQTDMVAIARAMGADGRRVYEEAELEDALEEAMRAFGPFVLDVHVDPNEWAPSRSRNQELIRQGALGAARGEHR